MASTVTTVVQTVTSTVSATAASATSGDRAPAQGGVFEGYIPTTYDPKNPIALFVIQASIVIGLTRLLHWPLSKIRQPRVIAEVIAVSQPTVGIRQCTLLSEIRVYYLVHPFLAGFRDSRDTSSRHRQCPHSLLLPTLALFYSFFWWVSRSIFDSSSATSVIVTVWVL